MSSILAIILQMWSIIQVLKVVFHVKMTILYKNDYFV